MDVGSSYVPAEVTAAFLFAQIEQADEITQRRMALWEKYHEWAQPFEATGLVRRPIVPPECNHNAHMYYLLLPSLEARTTFIDGLKRPGISAVFHYVPLHSSPAGARFGRTVGSMTVTDSVADRLVRMPLWLGLEDHVDRVQETAGRLLDGL